MPHVSGLLQDELALALPLSLRFERPLIQVEYSMADDLVMILLAPALGHLLDEDVVVDAFTFWLVALRQCLLEMKRKVKKKADDYD